MSGWQNHPFEIHVKAKERKAFCMCGLSQSGPLCDGSHQGTGLRPEVVEFSKDETVYACGCGQSKKRPYCDGTHTSLGETGEAAEPVGDTVAAVRWVRVAEASSLKDGETVTVDVGTQRLALTQLDGQVGAIENDCPHQGGPLGG